MFIGYLDSTCYQYHNKELHLLNL
uniref:Uncharacterized protein n=1 Tax=Tetranychus urticae TaxID=32264 RepID=T1JVB6_TETUR